MIITTLQEYEGFPMSFTDGIITILTTQTCISIPDRLFTGA